MRFSHPWLFYTTNFVEMCLDKPHEFFDLLLVNHRRILPHINVAVLKVFVDDSLHNWVVFRQQVHAISPVFHWLDDFDSQSKFERSRNSHLMQREVCISSCANVLIHVVPIEIFKLFCCEVHTGNLVCVMIWCVEAITIVEVDWRVRMSWAIACHFDF